MYKHQKTITKKLVKIGYCHPETWNGSSKEYFLKKRNPQILHDLGYYEPVLLNFLLIKKYNAYTTEQKILYKTEDDVDYLHSVKGYNPVLPHVTEHFVCLEEFRKISFEDAKNILLKIREDLQSTQFVYAAEYKLRAPERLFMGDRWYVRG